ncbi:putative nicotinate-nucleotide pyrophosphorylase [carboxylating] [bacterium HR17]|jgi:nicotinate-nucleotide pyrophosphorylase (carboxylating)|uniref:Probable nicotinate-nucleotide pyrophosphorylase [carboxylating] n=1 Tax=Candidatus Fervidibacter japonicus TaxID=2035412 RepID=A0A2H5XCJ6_9BACT|nr:putative nicotinate-nucleotide pyrophosphorylase [carboxylating] [bacterium HR17]
MLDAQWVRHLVERALSEDAPSGDVTTEAIVHADDQGVGILIAKSDGVICGLAIAQMVFTALDSDARFTARVADGDRVAAGMTIAQVQGRLRALLTGERTALNFLQRLSGIATLTRRFVDKVAPYGVRIADTRKTTPTLRLLEKYAVRCGGGVNHRFGLSDGVLIKDNHIRVAGSLTEAVRRVRSSVHHLLRIEVEAQSVDQVREALACNVDAILLDNLGVDEVQEAVEIVRAWSEQMHQPRPLLEVSGGVSLETVEAFARTGVDLISVGALTHSASALDISLEVT